MSQFTTARAKLTIASLEPEAHELAVEAHYNPKELQIDKPVPWLEHEQMQLEFSGIKSHTLSVELLFDGVEASAAVAPVIAKLERLSSPRDASSKREQMRRPHRCVVLWGHRGMPRLRCVIESLTTKYIVWDRDGTPLRAICTVKLKETAVDRDELRRSGELG